MRKLSAGIALLFALGISAILAAPAQASFLARPLEMLVDEAEVIVVGKVTNIDTTKFKRQGDERDYEAAVIEITQVLKGPKKWKEVRVGMPANGGVVQSTDIHFERGQEGIWLLNGEPQGRVFWARHPSQFQDKKEKTVLAKLIAARAKLPASKAVKGLEARAEAVKSENGFEVRFSLKNVSKKPIIICDFVGNRPLEVTWTGPDGKKRESLHYDWLKAVRLRPVSEENFITIKPGAVLFLGPRNKEQGIIFDMADKGEHKVTVGYSNKEDGKKLGVKGVWTGKVSAPTVDFTVK